MSNRTRLTLMLAAVAALIIIPLAIGGKFEGSDDQGTRAIEESRPGYKPWFKPIWEPPSPEIESLLFALQAAIGAGVIGYVIGRIHGSAAARSTTEDLGATSVHDPVTR